MIEDRLARQDDYKRNHVHCHICSPLLQRKLLHILVTDEQALPLGAALICNHCRPINFIFQLPHDQRCTIGSCFVNNKTPAR